MTKLWKASLCLMFGSILLQSAVAGAQGLPLAAAQEEKDLAQVDVRIIALDMERANKDAGRTLRWDEHIYRWFPLDRNGETFDRLRMQRERIMARQSTP